MFIITVIAIGVLAGSLTFVLMKNYVDNLPKHEKTFIFKKTKSESDQIDPRESDQIRKRMRLLHDEMQRNMYGGMWQSHSVITIHHILPDLSDKPEEQEESLETLNDELKKALSDEDYAKAAQIRDKIKIKEK